MTTISIVQGDITTQVVDAIVNAANTSLSGGGGVDGAIHAAAGPELVNASIQLAPCPTGEARITPGFHLPAKFVIHTVGPMYHVQLEEAPAFLAKCYQSCLDLAAAHGMKTIAFPAISTGVFGYPKELAAPIAVDTVKTWVTEHPDVLDDIRFVLHSVEDEERYRRLAGS